MTFSFHPEASAEFEGAVAYYIVVSRLSRIHRSGCQWSSFLQYAKEITACAAPDGQRLSHKEGSSHGP
jgi:hypothetical protein